MFVAAANATARCFLQNKSIGSSKWTAVPMLQPAGLIVFRYFLLGSFGSVWHVPASSICRLVMNMVEFGIKFVYPVARLQTGETGGVWRKQCYAVPDDLALRNFWHMLPGACESWDLRIGCLLQSQSFLGLTVFIYMHLLHEIYVILFLLSNF